MVSTVRYWLRASLAGPPGRATGEEDRRAVYRAAIQQFEELLDAAAVTGYASRPLPLFYSLSQAGRAIVASWGGELPKSHGLHLRDADVREDPLETLVFPGDRGWFQTVAEATRSPGLDGSVALGALVGSLPELSGRLLRGREWDSALYVEQLPAPEPARVSMDGQSWLRIGLAIDQDELNRPNEVAQLLEVYPAVQSRYRFDEPSPGGHGQLVWSTTAGGASVVLLLRDDLGGRPAAEALDAIAPPYRWVGRRWLRPALCGATPPSPLMTWWILLFALSMLARYHPVAWVQALDRHNSTAATELERAMDVALEAIPQLVLEALLGKPVLLPPFPEVPPLTL